MEGRNKQEWINAGYQMISELGFNHSNIESIARSINKNKSSFYHYFGDWEIFEESLLDQHLKAVNQFSADAKQCENIIPDMVNLFVQHKDDFLFHKQLRIYRKNKTYKDCFESAYRIYEDAIITKWTSFIKLDEQTLLARRILNLISENFLLQITPENFNYDWLKNYLINIADLLVELTVQAKK
ncbi:MAG: TetR/AcrR family transcriptional regulator [Saprospiraceae bacterium]|nr:TetR/AcrR family transcriptional regulator [Saprospiraceae bacterium]